ncbi:MAG: hypothetical protein KGJ23_09820 [Euryarchaeota archaeon]|nr:hypothetical protein [Euryarchaeota archaeon]MDE1881713.1 hypothetical protein [Euryarchaeota archaeon]MDE2045303.1 hypothetical protein [Thermoplasmata archaeon]
MIFDWVVSLLVASMVALTLVIIGMSAVVAMDRNTGVGGALEAVVTSVVTHVDRDEGLSAATSEEFTFGAAPVPGGNGTQLPSSADGVLYQFLVTPDFLIASANLPGGSVSRSGSFDNPVHLYSPATLQALAAAGYQTTQAQLTSWDHATPCITFSAGVDMHVSVVLAWVDASPTYLTIFYPTGFTPSACP